MTPDSIKECTDIRESDTMLEAFHYGTDFNSSYWTSSYDDNENWLTLSNQLCNDDLVYCQFVFHQKPLKTVFTETVN